MVTRSQFQAFVDRLKIPTNYRGIGGIGYLVRVPAQEKERLSASMRRQGFSNFRIWPAQERPEYHAVIYLEPLDVHNQSVLGYDLFTDPTRRSAMERARDEAVDAACGKVRLVQESEERGQVGFLIFAPVYRGGTPQTVQDRRAALQGFVYVPFQINDLLT